MQLTERLAPNPKLPDPPSQMSWRNLNKFRARDRCPEFYKECLRYAQYLWLQVLPARAILCLDRAMGADLQGNEECLEQHPLPYEAMALIIRDSPNDVFIGNPRVHFQHYADRLGEPRKQIRKWRAWACWAITRSIRPDFPDDPKHEVFEPCLNEIYRMLEEHGHPGEADHWQSVFERF